MSTAQLTAARPQRWDTPFGDSMTDGDVKRLLGVVPFRDIDRSKFAVNLPLEGILRNDARIVEYEPGDLVVREGDYGNSAFMILHGKLRVALESLPDAMVGHPAKPKRSWWRAMSQVWKSGQIPEVRRNASSQEQPAEGVAARGEGEATHIFLQDVPRVLDETRTATMTAGEFFGELAAIARTPRMASVFAETKSVLLEIRWQGLRDIMRRAPAIKQHIDRLYRENSLHSHLRQTPLFGTLGENLQPVADATQFESFGDFDWHREFKHIEALDPLERIEREPLIAEEGTPADHVLLIRSGFARLSQRFGAGHRTLAYLGKGQVFGLAELLTDAADLRLQYSLRAVGYVDVLKIPAEVVREIALAKLAPAQREELVAEQYLLREAQTLANEAATSSGNEAHSPLVDFLVDERLYNGTQSMIIDLDRCTRCDDCVRACATVHDGNPRFVREGPQFDRFQFAGACMHCVDPVCMIGCPTGAIARDTETGVVRINDNTCIGCATCANSCPYDNILMAELRDATGAPVIDLQTNLPILKATKCDLCAENHTGPACQQACAHDALVRMNLADLNATAQWMSR